MKEFNFETQIINNTRTSVRKESCEFFIEINRKVYDKEPSDGLLR